MSIKVRVIANSITRGVNENINAVIMVNDGYEILDNGKQVPKYLTQERVIQTQSLSTQDLEHLNLVNQQGMFLYAYADGMISAIRRQLNLGSSIMRFKPYGEDAEVDWNVKQVVESYNDWVKVVLWRK